MESFAQLGAALHERISELKRLALLRLEDGAVELFQQDLVGLEASVTALESQMSTLKACIQNELSAMPKVKAIIEASKLQSQHLNSIASNLPARLPRAMVTSVQGATIAPSHPTMGAAPLDAPHAGSTGATAVAVGEEAARKRKEAPRWYVANSEFDQVSSYLRGRLQPEKVNAAIDELATHATNNHKLMAAVKGGAGKLPPAERKRATELYHSVAAKDSIKGHFWFLDSDLKEGREVKTDKTGKTMLTLLRHLKRLEEVRCNVDGTSVTVYVLQEDPRRP